MTGLHYEMTGLPEKSGQATMTVLHSFFGICCNDHTPEKV